MVNWRCSRQGLLTVARSLFSPESGAPNFVNYSNFEHFVLVKIKHQRHLIIAQSEQIIGCTAPYLGISYKPQTNTFCKMLIVFLLPAL